MNWKRPYWVKGAIIGLLVTIIPLILMLVCLLALFGEGKIFCNFFILHLFMPIILIQKILNHTPTNVGGNILYYLISILIYPSLGALIGLIIDKIKNLEDQNEK